MGRGKALPFREVHYLVLLLALAAQNHLQIWKLLQCQDMENKGTNYDNRNPRLDLTATAGSWGWPLTPPLLACRAAIARNGEVRTYQVCSRGEGQWLNVPGTAQQQWGGAEYPPAECTPGLPHLFLSQAVCVCAGMNECVHVTACLHVSAVGHEKGRGARGARESPRK